MKQFVLILASTFLSLLFCEAGLRWFMHFRHQVAADHAADLTPDKPLDLEGALPYIEQLPIAPGADRRWFTENPPPLPNRKPVSPQSEERYREYERRGLFGPQSEYVWNRLFALSNACSPGSRFRNYPGSILVFDPPSGDIHPIYRFPANATTTAGLVTNQFGFRGPPLTLVKPPRTVRVAFVGASTTINNHNYPFSYPERVVSWLNRFAEANHFDVSFEVLNAGREGINSEDIPAIVRYEILPLDPDLVIYYEGANQFPTANLLVSPHIPARKEIDPRDPIIAHRVPARIRNHSAIGNLLDQALNGFSSIGEPRKPPYRLQWPASVDERNPDVDSRALPLEVRVIVRDLDAIRETLKTVDGQLVVCSFEWFTPEGVTLSPTRHEFIYKQLNTVLWPMRYTDIRRLADFQNRVFQRYAASRGIPFVDVASPLPQDPKLFSDAIHMTDTGERVKAWIVFQQLAPLVRREIENGRLPHASQHVAALAPPSTAASEMSLGCEEKPSGKVAVIDDGLSIYRRQVGSSGASIEAGRPLKITTPDRQFAYAATFKINMPSVTAGHVFAHVRARVVKGQVGIGILDPRNNVFLAEKSISSTAELEDVYVPLYFPDRADALVIRNAAPDGVQSEVLVQEIQLILASETKAK